MLVLNHEPGWGEGVELRIAKAQALQVEGGQVVRSLQMRFHGL